MDEHKRPSWPLRMKRSCEYKRRAVTQNFGKEVGCKLELKANSYLKEKQELHLKCFKLKKQNQNNTLPFNIRNNTIIKVIGLPSEICV